MGKVENIGRAELEVLRYVQDHHPASVRQVAEHFAESKGHVRTTILTVLERLRKKGYLKRRKTEGLFHYSPSSPKASMLRGLVDEFVEKTLGGSVSPFLAYLVNDAKLTKEELEELLGRSVKCDCPGMAGLDVARLLAGRPRVAARLGDLTRICSSPSCSKSLALAHRVRKMPGRLFLGDTHRFAAPKTAA